MRMASPLLALALTARGVAAAPTGLLPELDASSPGATLRSFQAETRRIEQLYAEYRARPTNAGEFAIADALIRVGAQLLDLGGLPPATREKSGNTAVGHLADVLARLPEIPP